MPTAEDLEHIVILSRLTDEMRCQLLPHISVMKAQNGDVLFNQYDPALRFFMLRRGKILLEQEITDLVTACVGTVEPGHAFGWSSMLNDEVYTAAAVCAQPSEIYLLEKATLARLFAQCPDLGLRMYQGLLLLLKKRYDTRSDQLRQACQKHPEIAHLFCT